MKGFKKHWKLYTIVVLILLAGIIYLILNLQNIALPFNQGKNVTKPYVDTQIYEDFNNSNEGVLYLRVYVSKPEYRDIVINSTSHHWYNQTTLSELGFTTLIKRDDFDNLTQNKYVKRIYIDSHAPKKLDSENYLGDTKLYVEPEIYQRFGEGAYIYAMVDGNSSEEISQIVNYLSKTDEIIMLSYKPHKTFFVGYISQKGLEFLLEKKGIISIRGGVKGPATQIS